VGRLEDASLALATGSGANAQGALDLGRKRNMGATSHMMKLFLGVFATVVSGIRVCQCSLRERSGSVSGATLASALCMVGGEY
jgi:hypothetical protein